MKHIEYQVIKIFFKKIENNFEYLEIVSILIMSLLIMQCTKELWHIVCRFIYEKCVSVTEGAEPGGDKGFVSSKPPMSFSSLRESGVKKVTLTLVRIQPEAQNNGQ